MTDSEQRRREMETILMKRHEERLARFKGREGERRKQRMETNETTEAFLETFNKEKRAITQTLSSLNGDVSKIELTTLFDELSQKLLTLHKFVSDSLSFLPGYDIRRAHEILKRLQLDIIEKREELLPKKKFAFKSRQKLVSGDKQSDIKHQKNVDSKSEIHKNMQTIHGFTNRCNETLTLLKGDCNEKDLYLANLQDCTIYIRGYPSAMKLEKLINTKIFCGPVNRSVFVNDCFDCEFQLACQQLRIHTTENTRFYIHVTSKAIIEDCEDVGFGVYSWDYEEIQEDFKSAKLSLETNNWKDVDDFNWLKLDQKSPNWYFI